MCLITQLLGLRALMAPGDPRLLGPLSATMIMSGNMQKVPWGKLVVNALTTLLKNDPVKVDGFSVHQIVALCGSGRLSDQSEASAELRQYFQIAKSENLFKYAKECLEGTVDRGGYVLQDVINEFGRRLDYNVQNGLYQGKSNAIGFDGLWTAPDGHVIIVEVKTSDAYRINLDTIAHYGEQLIHSGEIDARSSSVLLVVGRQDTGDLEAQVRGSRHAWTFRIISTDALMKLVALKENAELASVSKIHELLVPFEYTRLDKIIDIAFTVAEDTSAAAENEQVREAEDSVSSGDAGRRQRHTSSEVLSQARAAIVAALSNKYVPLVKKSRALYWSADKSVRAVVTVSKEYEGGGYWYAYHPNWDKFLTEGSTGLYVLGCVGRDEAFAIPHDWIAPRLENLYQTPNPDGTAAHWHLILDSGKKGNLELRLKSGKSEPLETFTLPLSGMAAKASTHP